MACRVEIHRPHGAEGKQTRWLITSFAVAFCLWTAVSPRSWLWAEATPNDSAASRWQVRRLPPVDEVLTAAHVAQEPSRDRETPSVVPSAAQMPISPPSTEALRAIQRPVGIDAMPSRREAVPAFPCPEGVPAVQPPLESMPFDVPVCPTSQYTPEEYQEYLRNGWHPLKNPAGCLDWYRVDGQVRAYYLNDQRIEWTGLEATFGAEAALLPVYRHRFDAWEMTVLGEFYLNQPFDRNILADTAERRSYAANFEVETFEMSQLSIALRRGDFEVTVGKMATPFGRYYFPLYTNSRMDAPFIRTEAIRWRETGVLVRYDPDWFVCDVAITNGGDNRDANSSKAIISRVGVEHECWAGGVSVKYQDGIGSESQKQYNNHIGADLMYRWSIFTLSGEVIYDQYGFRRPGYDPDDIFWGRSIYYRDLNKADGEPIKGLGYYINLGFCKDRWSGLLNYGEYYPESLGVEQHDIPNRRGIVKLDYALAQCLGIYGVVMVENGGYIAQDNRPRLTNVLLTGVQYTF